MTIRLAGLIPVLALLAASGAHAQGTPPSAPDAPAEVSGAAAPAATRHAMHKRHHAMPAAASPAAAASAGDGETPAGKAAAQALATTPSDTPVPYVDFPPQAASSPKGMMHHAMMHGHMAAKKVPASSAQ